MAYWLMKTEPSTFSFEELLRDGHTVWDGVRNHQAKKNLAAMQVGEQILIYHSVVGKEVVGIAEITKAHYPDPTDPEKKWLVVDIKPIRKLEHPVSLQTIKNTPELANIALVRQGRLSVMPLEEKEFQQIISLGSG